MVVCSANTATATPIRIPAGMQRFTVFSVTKRAAAPAPTTIPTATMAFSSVGVALSAMPSATGTHSTNRKRSVTPAPRTGWCQSRRNASAHRAIT